MSMPAKSAYRPMPAPFCDYEIGEAYDEMFRASGRPRTHYRNLPTQLLNLPPEGTDMVRLPDGRFVALLCTLGSLAAERRCTIFFRTTGKPKSRTRSSNNNSRLHQLHQRIHGHSRCTTS